MFALPSDREPWRTRELRKAGRYDVGDVASWKLDQASGWESRLGRHRSQHAIRCSLDFFSVDHVLFASDSPFDPEQGPGYIRATIANLEALDLSAEDRAQIYEGNARRLLGL